MRTKQYIGSKYLPMGRIWVAVMVVTFLDLGQHMAFLTPLVPIVTTVCNVGTFLEGGTWWKFCSRTIHAEKEIIHMLYVTCQFQFAGVPGNRCAEETVHGRYTCEHKQTFSSGRDTEDRKASWKANNDWWFNCPFSFHSGDMHRQCWRTYAWVKGSLIKGDALWKYSKCLLYSHINCASTFIWISPCQYNCYINMHC